MRIRTIEGEYFDLPEGIVPDREYTSPIWAEYGSGTLPLSLPRTKRNMRLTGYAHDLHGWKDTRKINVVMEDEGVELRGVMDVINSALDVVVGFNESEVYEKMDSIRLEDIPDLPSKSMPVNELMSWLWNVWCGAEDRLGMRMEDIEYRVFPVMLKKEEGDTKNYYTILNRLTASNNPTIIGLTAHSLPTLVGGTERTVEYPEGYSVAPFVRLGYLLKYIIVNALGYNVTENPFLTDGQLRELCVLHNSIDMCCAGNLDWKDMMPSATIGDVLDMIRARFGAHVFFDSNTMSARIVLMARALNSSSFVDWSGKVASEIKEMYEGYKYITVKENRTDNRATETETYEEFCAKHNFVYNECDEVQIFTQFESEPAVKLRKATGEYYTHDVTQQTKQYVRVSTSAFDQNRKVSELEEYELSHASDMITTVKQHQAPTYGERVPMPFMDCDPRFLTTVYDSGEENGTNGDCPLSLAYYMGAGVTPPQTKYYWGSTRCMDDEGKNLYVDASGVTRRVNLENYGDAGLFMNYLKDWDSVMRHAGLKSECTMKLTRMDMEMMNPETIIHIDGVLYMYESIKLKENDMADVVLRRVSLQKPFDTDYDHQQPVITPQIYFWKIFSGWELWKSHNRQSVLSEFLTQTGIPSSEVAFVADQSYDKQLTQPVMSEFYGLKPPAYRYEKVTRTYNAEYKYTYLARGQYYQREGTFTYEAGVISD